MSRKYDNSPLLNYTDFNLWANPEENGQYQVKINRVSTDYGEIGNFPFMNKWRILPKAKRYFHVFTVGGLNGGYWGFFGGILKRSPIDRWINLGALCRARGIKLDVYDQNRISYSKSHCWVMVTYDGLVLMAMEKLKRFPIDKNTQMYFRVYRPTKKDSPDRFDYVTLVYENVSEMQEFANIYANRKSAPGYVFLYHNGVFTKEALGDLTNLQMGDVLELVYDPSVVRIETYNYSTLKDFYSTLDNKRKLIIHSPKVRGDFTLRYFDDNDYYMTGPDNRGIYLSRNNVSDVRQLTHNDVSISDDMLRDVSSKHNSTRNIQDNQITVFIRKTDWEIELPHESQRIRYLYRFNDTDIIRAMTGARSNMEEWLADSLEKGPVLTLMRNQFLDNNKVTALNALGYNASTRVLSETIIKSKLVDGEVAVKVPISYRDAFVAFEYDQNGKLIDFHSRTDTAFYTPVSSECDMVEFTLGIGGRNLDITITNETTDVDPNWDLRVYTVGYNIVDETITSNYKDVTGTDIYEINDNKLIWKELDTVNQRGVLLTNKKCIAYSFELEHLDHSLSFALTHIYEGGGLLTPIAFAQIDVWLNGSPLIDNVEWVYKNDRIHILAKEHIVDGPQQITIRAFGFHDDVNNPRNEVELGFIDGGVMGRVPRYNLRGDRVTRTVIGGSLYQTDYVPRAERNVPDDLWSVLNGLPYMVKHCYTPVRFVNEYDHYHLLEESRQTDKRVSDYLTKWLPKPSSSDEEIINEPFQQDIEPGTGTPVIPSINDKYRVFSPFLSVIVNMVINRLITVPLLEEGFSKLSGQDIEEVVKPYKWWLEFDPIIRDYDQRYFTITPYANYNRITLTPTEFIFIKQVSEIYLNGVIPVERYFDITQN